MNPRAFDHAVELHFGDASGFELIVSRRGAALTGASYRGQSVMPRVDPSNHPLSAGDLLLPWPNRIRDGVWSIDGASGVVPINEPARNNAIHGLVRALDFVPEEMEPRRGVLRSRLEPSESYPFELEVEVVIALAGSELRITTTVTNRGPARAPWAFGVHPYVGIDGLPAERLTLQLSASEVLVTDDRLLPIGREAVSGLIDVRQPRALSELSLDHAFTGLGAGALATLTASDGRALEVHADEGIRYLQVFTPKERGTVLGAGGWVAVEPMTAPAEAFNSGEGLRWLQPGESASVAWSLRASGSW